MASFAAGASQRPLFFAAIAFALGAALEPHAPDLHGLAWIAISAVTSLGCAALAGRIHRTCALGLVAALFACGIGAARMRVELQSPGSLAGEYDLDGVVEGAPVRFEGRTRFLLKVAAYRNLSGAGAAGSTAAAAAAPTDAAAAGSTISSAGGVEALSAAGTAAEAPLLPCRFRLRLSAGGEPPLLPGDRVRLRARLWPPPPALNPGAPPSRERARAEGVAAFGVVLERQIAVVGRARPHERLARGVREGFRRLAADALPDPEVRGLVTSLAIGDRADLDAEVSEDFQASGLAHVLSISGLHVAVVAGAAWKVLRWLLSRSQRLLLAVDARALAAIAALTTTWWYVELAGAEVPAVRSGLMASALFAAVLVGRDSDALTSLASALLLVVAADPGCLHSISFQLSFAAVGGLVLVSRPLREALPLKPPDAFATGPRRLAAKALEALVAGGCASLAASLATAPMVVEAFHRASLAGVLANAVALPVASALTALAAASALACAIFEPLAVLPLILSEPLARTLLALSSAFSAMPLAAVDVGSLSALGWIGWYGLLAALALSPVRRRLATAIAVPCGCILAMATAWPLAAPLVSNRLEVTFLAVGHGDAVLVRLPGNDALLVDGGGDPTGRHDVGRRVVIPALLESRVHRLRAAVLTHPHPDHLLGLQSVLERVSVGELWVSATLAPDDAAGLLALAQRKGIAVRRLAAGDRLQGWPATRIDVLGPDREFPPASGNDGSLVLRVCLGEHSFLLAGDAEAAAESLLAARPEIRSTVLKVPHHGSASSSSLQFLAAVQPRHAVLSVGANRAGLPRPEILARYERLGIPLHRTDQHGAITFKTDGSSLTVEHFVR